jgi:hypothetical protein
VKLRDCIWTSHSDGVWFSERVAYSMVAILHNYGLEGQGNYPRRPGGLILYQGAAESVHFPIQCICKASDSRPASF